MEGCGNKSSASRATTRVRFCQTLYVVSSDVYTKEEQKSIWYSCSDLRAMQVEAVKTIKTFLGKYPTTHSGRPMDEDDMCWRGLEYISSKKRKETSKRFVRDVVEEQRRLGYSNPNSLRYFVERNSKRASDRALRAGSQDFFDANQQIRNDITTEAKQNQKQQTRNDIENVKILKLHAAPLLTPCNA